MPFTIVACFYKLFHDACVPEKARNEVARAVIRGCVRIKSYRDQRKAIKDLIGDASEHRIYVAVQELKHCYEMQVMLWRALYCYVETQDIAKASYLFQISNSDLAWVVTLLSETQELQQIPTAAPAHWTTTPITQQDVYAIVQHRRIQSTIQGLLRYSKSGVVWAFDQGITKEDLKADLEYKAIATILKYEASRRSKWHLINVVVISMGNELNNKTRKSTSLESGRIVEETIAGPKENEPQHSHAAAMQRIVSLVSTNDEGDEFEVSHVPADNDFASLRKVKNTIECMKQALNERILNYLNVTVLGVHDEPFEKWIEQQEIEHKHQLTEDAIVKKARQFFKLTAKDIKIMQEALIV